MVQPIDSNMTRPMYNAVKINIKKPEVNANNTNSSNEVSVTNNHGIYNAVDINIDNPKVNTDSTRKIYDYPEATETVYYEMANLTPITLPSVAYHTTNVILPKMENEIELENQDKTEEILEKVNSEEITDKENTDKTNATFVVPEPNYTTTEAEKGLIENIDSSLSQLNFRGVENKTPEIIPSEDIKPNVDIHLVLSNLRNPDYDVQAQQMEEIARISLDTKENIIPYLVRDVFVSLIDITKKDTSKLETPSMEQIQARNKIIANFIALENADKNTKQSLPFEISEKDFELANTLSPMEQAERNKEYALYTISILAKTYVDEVEKKTGDVIPITDLPGSAAIVDALRFNPNSGVKIAAIDSLRHIQRPEYAEELNTLYTLAKADPNPQVSNTATRALAGLNNK